MLATNIDLTQKYDYLEEEFKKGYEFLRKKDLKTLPLGRADVDGDEVLVSVQECTTMSADACKYESHNRYFDIQYVVEDQEQFGCVKRTGFLEDTPYNETDDIVFLGNRGRAGPSS